MTSKEFVIKSIKELVTLFPNTKARYENHEISNTHFVEVVPNEVYRLNKDYQDWEEKILFQFIEIYPSQNLCFISDDAIVGIDKSEFEIKGILYDLLYSFNDICYQKLDEIKVSQTDILAPSLSDTVINRPLAVLSDITGSSFNISNNLFFNNRVVAYEAYEKVVIEPPYDNNYAIAA